MKCTTHLNKENDSVRTERVLYNLDVIWLEINIYSKG